MSAPDPLGGGLQEAYRAWAERQDAGTSWDAMARAAREHIAAEIETYAAPYTKPPYPNTDQAHAYRQAARIARGGSDG